MPSYRITISPSRRAAARIVSDVRRGLQKALVIENEKRGMTQSEIARLIGVHRSVINREFRGRKDMGIGRVGELAWALGRKVVISFPEADQVHGQNEVAQIPPTPEPVTRTFIVHDNRGASPKGVDAPNRFTLAA